MFDPAERMRMAIDKSLRPGIRPSWRSFDTEMEYCRMYWKQRCITGVLQVPVSRIPHLSSRIYRGTAV